MPKKKTYRTIFIACEGSNTEPNYFGRLAETIDDARRLRVVIHPRPPVLLEEVTSSEARKSTAVQMVEIAQQQLLDGTYDDAWVVFDRDGYTKHAEAFEKAQKKVAGKTVHIAFSSIAFEHWILLHFERNETTFAKSDHLIQQCFVERNLFKNYDKSRKTDPYPKLSDKTLTAIENAAWLRHRQQTALAEANGRVFDLNPYTDVDELVKELLGIDLSFSWTNFGQSTSFAGHQIIFTKTDAGISVVFENRSYTSLVFNAQNLSAHFELRGFEELRLAESVQIAPNETVTFEISYAGDLPDDFLLILKIANQHLFVT
jgi:hypothetical protein